MSKRQRDPTIPSFEQVSSSFPNSAPPPQHTPHSAFPINNFTKLIFLILILQPQIFIPPNFMDACVCNSPPSLCPPPQVPLTSKSLYHNGAEQSCLGLQSLNSTYLCVLIARPQFIDMEAAEREKTGSSRLQIRLRTTMSFPHPRTDFVPDF